MVHSVAGGGEGQALGADHGVDAHAPLLTTHSETVMEQHADRAPIRSDLDAIMRAASSRRDYAEVAASHAAAPASLDARQVSASPRARSAVAPRAATPRASEARILGVTPLRG